jgi:hypothetical protein
MVGLSLTGLHAVGHVVIGGKASSLAGSEILGSV